MIVKFMYKTGKTTGNKLFTYTRHNNSIWCAPLAPSGVVRQIKKEEDGEKG